MIRVDMENNLYTIEEIAILLRLSRLTVYRYISSGKLSAYKLGRDYRVRKDDLESFLDAHKTKGKAQ